MLDVYTPNVPLTIPEHVERILRRARRPMKGLEILTELYAEGRLICTAGSLRTKLWQMNKDGRLERTAFGCYKLPKVKFDPRAIVLHKLYSRPQMVWTARKLSEASGVHPDKLIGLIAELHENGTIVPVSRISFRLSDEARELWA
jgi:hypothetical protein